MLFKYFIISYCVFALQEVAAQTRDNRVKFGAINQVGLLTGSRGEAFRIETINGIKKDSWYAGIGVGLDFYKNRTIPLFLDVRRDLLKLKNTPFIYLQGGVNFVWLTDNDKAQRSGGLTYSNPPGGTYDAGIGWKLAGKNARALLLSAGYNFKQVKETVKLNGAAPTTDLEEQNTERYNYLYRRVVIKLGLLL